MTLLSDISAEFAGEPLFREMVEAAPTAMLLVDRSGRIVLVNAETERMFGYPRLALLAQKVELLVPAAARPGHATLREAFQRAPVKRAMGSAQELTGARADGAELPIEVGLTPIETAAGPCVLAVITDVSERRRAEAARAHLAAVVENSRDAIVSKTLAGIVTSWNPAAEEILGWPAAEIVGQAIDLILPADRRAEEVEILARVRAGGSVTDLATVRQRRDGTLVPVAVTISPIRDARGRVIGASKILRDATERSRGETAMLQAQAALELAVASRTRELAEHQEARRRAEAALAQAQKLEAVGQLTGGVAHDFNNLLTVIEGNLHLIHDLAQGNERMSRPIAGIERAVERGSRLTGHLLAFSRRQVLMPQVVRLDEVVRDFSLLVMRATGEAVRLTVDAEPDLWPVLLDRAQFESALLNLAINARDAMPEGGALVVSVRNVDGAADPELSPVRHVCVQVSDSGIGMPAEVAARAVEPFFTTKPVGKGSGLGLSQVYGFVQQSGGTLRIDSRPGGGTTIAMFFPAVEVAAAEGPVEAGAPATMLLVEDDAEVLALMKETLRAAGHRVMQAPDPAGALALLERGTAADVLVCEVQTAQAMGGVELAARARRLRPGLLVLLTSGAPRGKLDMPDGGGPFPVLAKPFRPHDLLARVQSLLTAQ